MFAAVWLPLVPPGRMTVVPLSVAPFPRTTSAVVPETLSKKVVPAGALPAEVLNDQRFTSAAPTGRFQTVTRSNIHQISFFVIVSAAMPSTLDAETEVRNWF